MFQIIKMQICTVQIIKMQILPKTKGFCNKRVLLRKKTHFFNKNYICILRKTQIPIIGF